MEVRVVIVGAGIAGLTAARALRQKGVESVLVDKSRAVGGRMATRTIGDARFDHGAQHFGIRSERFGEIARVWREEGVMREWYRTENLEPRNVGVGGMRRIPEYLAADLDVRTATSVERVEQDGSGVAVVAANGDRIQGSAAIVTPPIPQTIALLSAGQIDLPAGLEKTLAAIHYQACLAVMLQPDGPTGLPDGHLSDAGGSIAWIADNADKGTSPVPSLTIHSTPAFAARHLEESPEQWKSLLVTEARRWVGGPATGAVGHRWRFAEPTSIVDLGSVLLDAPVALAGEVFAGARVEGAVLSGLAAADAIIERLP